MICGFDPAKSEMMDGYLELPSENCMEFEEERFRELEPAFLKFIFRRIFRI